MAPDKKFMPGPFISPFIRTIAARENISNEDLYKIRGTGLGGRITKEDILVFLEARDLSDESKMNTLHNGQNTDISLKADIPVSNADIEFVELGRVRKLIASNMLRSKEVAPHVTSFVEVNITRIVNYRNKNKGLFKSRYSENLTFLPFFIESVAKAIKAYPSINASLHGDYLAIKKHINIGIATALPDGNLIVPVINDADCLDIAGLALKIGDLGRRARQSALKPNEIQGGTFTLTNVGPFGNIGGTPIINQPELAILAIGTIIKKPMAIFNGNDYGISIQDVVELWLSYDHRIVDGALGGSFLKQIADNLIEFDDTREL